MRIIFVVLFFCIGSTFVFAECKLELSKSLSKDQPLLHNFLSKVLDAHELGDPNNFKKIENFKHLKRMVSWVRRYAEEIRREGLDPALLEAGMFLSDIAKNPYFQDLYAPQYGGSKFKVFLDHARLALVEGKTFKEAVGLDDASWNIIVEVIKGHDGPAIEGSWWKDKFESEFGIPYDEITSGSKYAFIHAIMDRIDQGGSLRDADGIYQGGMRKISFDMLEPYKFDVAETLKYSLSSIYQGSLKQVDSLIDIQENFFPNGMPNFLNRLIHEFKQSPLVFEEVRFVKGDIIFLGKDGKVKRISKVSTEPKVLYRTQDSPILLSPERALEYFWDKR